MALFRSLENETSDVISNMLNNNVLPSKASYRGISALKNSDVLTAVSIISADISRFPISVIQKTDGKYTELKDVQYLLNTKVNEKMDAYHWRFAMVANTILTGNCVSQIIRDPKTGVPMDIRLFLPSETFINRIDPNNILYELTPDGTQNVIVCKPEDVIHFKFLSVDGVEGRSPLLSLGNEIELQESGVETLTRFFKSGMKGGIVKMLGARLSAESRKKAREEFELAQQGAQAGAPIVLDSTMEYQPLQIDTNVLNLITSNNYSTAQIAKALMVPGYKLGVNSPNQSVKQLNEDYFSSSLPYYFVPIISELQMKMLNDDERHNLRLEFDTRAITGITMADAVQAVNNGIMTGNEARVEMDKLARQDIPEMDAIYSTLNTVDIQQKAEYQEQQKSVEGGEDGGKGTSQLDNKV